jgi:hypothetical protein
VLELSSSCALAYDFDIEYMKGKNNVVDDALSRKPTLCSLTSISVGWKVSIISEYAKDSFATKILDKLVDDNKYKVVDELIYYKNRIFLVPGSKIKEGILRAFMTHLWVVIKDTSRHTKKLKSDLHGMV